MEYTFKNQDGLQPDIITIFNGKENPEGPALGNALIVPRGCDLPKGCGPVLYVTRVYESDRHYDPDDMTDSIWITIRKTNSTATGARYKTIVSDFELPKGNLQGYIPEPVPTDIINTVHHFNTLLRVKEYLDMDFKKVYTEAGVKMIAPQRYYYHAGGSVDDPRKTYRIVDIRKAEVPLQEYLTKKASEDFDQWYGTILEAAQQYVTEITPDELAINLLKDLSACLDRKEEIAPTDGEYPDGMYINL